MTNIRTRQLGYAEYGISKAEISKLLRVCRASGFPYRALVAEAAQKTNPEIAESLVRNICDRECWMLGNAYIDEASFYGYRKKCLYYLRIKLKYAGKM